jgi:hypothetical protein
MVTLPEPSPKIELFRQFEELAHSTGFTEYRGRPISDEMFAPGAKFSSFNWFRNDASGVGYRIGLAWRPWDAEKPSQVRLIFYNESMDDFTAKEWLIFEEWKEVILPAAFPGATIEVARHPAKFTAHEMLLEISRVTGMPIPEKYMKFVTD